MLRFSQLLTLKDESELETEEIYPQPIFSKFFKNGKSGKWAAYTDKYLVFKNHLKNRLQKRYDIIHITDQSNSVYVSEIKKWSNTPTLVTCHDLIAIRQAKKEFKEAPKTSTTGKLLQSWIYKSLNKADYYACDSEQTKNDLNRIINTSVSKSKVIHLGTEFELKNLDQRSKIKSNLAFDPCKMKFILHVGSAAWYKNRKAVFRCFINAHKSFPKENLKLIIVGPEPQIEELDDQLSNSIKAHQSSIHCLQHLNENTLIELYKYAQALVFPSFIEGFGWPPLEAAIQGCPVVTNRAGAISDLLGNYAKYVEAENQASIDKSVQELLRSPESKRNAISLPTHEDCRRQYFDLYEQMMAN